MLRRFLFISVFLSLLVILGWMSQRTPLSSVSLSGKSVSSALAGEEDSLLIRQELVEVLDHIAHQEQAFQAMFGHYTQILGQLGFNPSRRLAGRYEFRIVHASKDRFLLHAFSERQGKVEDLVSIDQNFEVHSNFSLPLSGEMARRPATAELHSESLPTPGQSQNLDVSNSPGHSRHDLVVEPIPSAE